MSQMELYYFPIRGRAEAIRLLLEATKTPYKDIVPENWPELKKTLPFGQLPYFVHGDLKLVQSCSILRYIARETNTYGANNKEAAKIDMIIDGEEEWRLRYTQIIYSKPPYTDWDQSIAEYKESYLPQQLANFEALLKGNNDGSGFMVGDKFSCADALMFEILDVNVSLKADCLDNSPLLKAYRARIAEHEGIKEYLGSGKRPAKINGNGKGQ